MGAAAAELADVAIVTDDNPRSEDPAAIRAQVRVGAPQAQDIGDRRAAIAAAVALLREGDVLVVAGKGHEQGQTIAGVVHPFDDVAVTAKALEGVHV
jgi:UDP-N-acetylmuramoyl-L-alanyl-D-glutamate--2,6-diaminopimelate ligase